MWYIKGNCFFNTAAHRGAIQASCYPMTSKTNCTTMVFEKFCITTRTSSVKGISFNFSYKRYDNGISNASTILIKFSDDMVLLPCSIRLIESIERSAASACQLNLCKISLLLVYFDVIRNNISYILHSFILIYF